MDFPKVAKTIEQLSFFSFYRPRSVAPALCCFSERGGAESHVAECGQISDPGPECLTNLDTTEGKGGAINVDKILKN